MQVDVVALDTLLDDELSYVRTGGRIQTRPQFIDAIKKQKVVYESIKPGKVRVKVYDGLALATGRAQMRVSSAAGVSSYGVRVTEVYVRRDGRWMRTVWEAARLKDGGAVGWARRVVRAGEGIALRGLSPAGASRSWQRPRRGSRRR